MLPHSLAAQTIAPSGAESTPTGARQGEQLAPAVSLSPTGGFVVWEDNTIDGTNGTGIGARRLGADWTPVSEVFRVNERQPGDQLAPQAVQLADGNTMVAWQTRLGAKHSLLVRLLDPNGAFLTKEIQINPETTTQSYKYKTVWQIYNRNRYRSRTYKLKDTVVSIRELAGHPILAALPDGGSVVVYEGARRYETNTWGIDHRWKWTGSRSLTNSVLLPVRVNVDFMQEIFFQRISATGEKLGPEVRVNEYANYNQRTPALAVLDNGNFVVAWVSEQPRTALRSSNYRVDIYARVYNSQGEPLGAEFLVSGDEELMNANPALGALPGGAFTVAWSRQENLLTRHWDVVRRSYSATAAPLGGMETVNLYTAGNQFAPRFCSAGEQQLMIWTSVGQDGAREGVIGRLFSGGLPVGEEFRVNTTTAARQFQPAIATDGQGRFLAIWAGYTGASGFDLFTQSYLVSASPPAGGGGLLAGAGAVEINRLGPAVGDVPVPRSDPEFLSGAGTAPLEVGVSALIEKRRISWNTRQGMRYQVEVSKDLRVWTAVGPPRLAAGTTDAVPLELGTDDPVGFYRVIQLPMAPTTPLTPLLPQLP